MQAAQTTETWRSVSAVKIRGGYRDTGRVGGSNNERKGKGRWGSQLSLEDTRVLLVRSQHGTTETYTTNKKTALAESLAENETGRDLVRVSWWLVTNFVFCCTRCSLGQHLVPKSRRALWVKAYSDQPSILIRASVWAWQTSLPRILVWRLAGSVTFCPTTTRSQHKLPLRAHPSTPPCSPRIRLRPRRLQGRTMCSAAGDSERAQSAAIVTRRSSDHSSGGENHMMSVDSVVTARQEAASDPSRSGKTLRMRNTLPALSGRSGVVRRRG